mgnify:CR=1 FL=1
MFGVKSFSFLNHFFVHIASAKWFEAVRHILNVVMVLKSGCGLMVLILDGNSAHDAHVFFKEKNKICNRSRTCQMPLIGQITEITVRVRTYFSVTIKYKYCGCVITNLTTFMSDAF